MSAHEPSLSFAPIGYVQCNRHLKFNARHQPDLESDETNYVVLNPGHQFELALEDLAGFDRVWLVSWFHTNVSWRPRALPPRGPAVRRGLFATRSPHRPNPIGLTCVTLKSIDKLTLTVGPLDLIDGTPILDIKPYLATVDSFPGSSMGWVDEVEASYAQPPRFQIELTEKAQFHLAWLRTEWGIDFTERAFALLRHDPTPHRTRRILRLSSGQYRMACGPWRLFFHVREETILIDSVGKGYSDESLQTEGSERIQDRDAQIAFALLPL